jgi:VanZ family protein
VTKNERNLLFFWLPPLIWAAVLFIESATAVPPQVLDLGGLPHWDKVLHFGLYALLALLLLRALRQETRLPWIRAAVGAFVLASCYGATDELHQWFTPGRSMDFWDWTADTAGAAIVFLARGRA